MLYVQADISGDWDRPRRTESSKYWSLQQGKLEQQRSFVPSIHPMSKGWLNLIGLINQTI
jgi:hypothetical protein